jgi:DNA-directed RNA polymerase beta subunit
MFYLVRLKELDFQCPGKSKLIDGRTGEYFAQDVVVGCAYFLKADPHG